MSLMRKFARVTKSRPCPICKHDSWCLLAKDGSSVICMRTPSSREIRMSCGVGYEHNLMPPSSPVPGPERNVATRGVLRPQSFLAAAKSFCEALSDDRKGGVEARRLINELGLPLPSCSTYRVGWSQRMNALTFPMRKPDDFTIIGIRVRSPNGAKLSMRGSRSGLFLPCFRLKRQEHDTVIITEGPTDTICAHACGFYAVGRPSNSGGHKMLVEFVETYKPKRVIVCIDWDSYHNTKPSATAITLRAAYRLLDELDRMPFIERAALIKPPRPYKDFRDWFISGNATRRRVMDAWAAAPDYRPPIV